MRAELSCARSYIHRPRMSILWLIRGLIISYFMAAEPRKGV